MIVHVSFPNQSLIDLCDHVVDMMTSGDMMENIVGKKDEVLKSLEETGMVPPGRFIFVRFDETWLYFSIVFVINMVFDFSPLHVLVIVRSAVVFRGACEI